MRSFYIIIPTLTLVNMGAAMPQYHPKPGIHLRNDKRQFHAADYAFQSPPQLNDGALLEERGLFDSTRWLSNLFGSSSSSSSDSSNSENLSITANDNSAKAGENGATIGLGQVSGPGTFATNGIPLKPVGQASNAGQSDGRPNATRPRPGNGLPISPVTNAAAGFPVPAKGGVPSVPQLGNAGNGPLPASNALSGPSSIPQFEGLLEGVDGPGPVMFRSAGSNAAIGAAGGFISPASGGYIPSPDSFPIPVSGMEFNLPKDPLSQPYQPDSTSTFGQAFDLSAASLPLPYSPSGTIDQTSSMDNDNGIPEAQNSNSFGFDSNGQGGDLFSSLPLAASSAAPTSGHDMEVTGSGSTPDPLSSPENIVVSPFLDSSLGAAPGSISISQFDSSAVGAGNLDSESGSAIDFSSCSPFDATTSFEGSDATFASPGSHSSGNTPAPNPATPDQASVTQTIASNPNVRATILLYPYPYYPGYPAVPLPSGDVIPPSYPVVYTVPVSGNVPYPPGWAPFTYPPVGTPQTGVGQCDCSSGGPWGTWGGFPVPDGCSTVCACPSNSRDSEGAFK